MKTFKQYLLEEEFPSLKTVLDDCDEFLTASGGNYLIRGIKNLKATSHFAQDPKNKNDPLVYYKIPTRMDRRPMDTSPTVHAAIDDWFDEHFGFKARSQAVFGFGQGQRMSEVESYGPVYLIFPVGPFKFVWSEDVGDLFGLLSNVDLKEPDIEDELDRVLTGAQYTSTNLEAATTGKCEVMVKCAKYYAFPIAFRPTIDRYLDGK